MRLNAEELQEVLVWMMEHNHPRDLADEAILRYIIYGDPKVNLPCTLLRDFLEGRAIKRKYNPKFVEALIDHIVKCPACGQYYDQWNIDKSSPESG